jgi:toxin YoeB
MSDYSFTKDGFDEYLYWQSQDRKTLKRINALLKDIRANGALKGIGKPENLKYRPGYSRRIDEVNRLVYDMDQSNNIIIISCRGHYED